MSTPQEHDYIGLSDKILSPSSSSASSEIGKNPILNLKDTELRLGLPGSEAPDRRSGARDGVPQNGLKRVFSDTKKWGLCVNDGSEVDLGKNGVPKGNNSVNLVDGKNETTKAQVVGWPPVRSSRKQTNNKPGLGCLYVKVSMDGAPYLRKIDLKMYHSYSELSSKMFSYFAIGQYGEGLTGKERPSEGHSVDLLSGSEYVLTYEDKDGDWMLVGDVPWEMFADSCKRLRIMKGCDAIGLAPRSMQKKTQN